MQATKASHAVEEGLHALESGVLTHESHSKLNRPRRAKALEHSRLHVGGFPVLFHNPSSRHTAAACWPASS